MNTTKRTKAYLKASEFLFPSEYVSLDFETTGLSPSENEIIEIGAVKIKDGVEIDRFSSLVKPKAMISDYIQKLTGISNEMVKDQEGIETVLPRFLEFLNDDHVVGQNVGFDLDFLYHAMASLSIEKRYAYTDTLKLSLVLLPMMHHHRLSDLVDYYHIENGFGFHRALGDCINTMSVYEAMKHQIMECYGSLENFIQDPRPILPKSSVLPYLAACHNIKTVSESKIREDVIKGEVSYFTNPSGLDVSAARVSYDAVDLESMLFAYSQDPYTEIYEKPFREKRRIKEFLKLHDAILPNRKDTNTKAYLTFSPLEIDRYLKMKKDGLKVFLSKDVIDFIDKMECQGGKTE